MDWNIPWSCSLDLADVGATWAFSRFGKTFLVFELAVSFTNYSGVHVIDDDIHRKLKINVATV
jgi:hypothetical protein